MTSWIENERSKERDARKQYDAVAKEVLGIAPEKVARTAPPLSQRSFPRRFQLSLAPSLLALS